jgi:endonuclease YncB( thermonuclease family)
MAAIALVAFAGCSLPAGEEGEVTRVIDGDTVVVDGFGPVRLVGIDTPEQGRCGYREATSAMVSLVLGKQVHLVRGSTEDADVYGRLLRYVEVDGTDAGAVLLRDGYARARYNSSDGYPRHFREARYDSLDQDSPPQPGCPR